MKIEQNFIDICIKSSILSGVSMNLERISRMQILLILN